MMVYIGIDPGKKGAIAAISEWDRSIDVRATPLVLASGGRGRPEYDLVEIRRHIEEFLLPKAGRNRTNMFATVEKGQPMPPTIPGGSSANFARGVARGWEWLFVGLEIPYQLVAPITWQKALHAGTPGADTKQRSILAASRLFPSVSLKRTPRCHGPDDGIAEALLLAEYGRRTHAGAGGVLAQKEGA